jgi:Winged helix-turn-helix DNA-binding
VQMLSERVDSRSSVITMQKLKDEESSDRYDVKLRRVVLGLSDTGQEVSTLVVDTVAVAGAKADNAGNADEVLKALVDNPGASIADMARASGVHASSVNRRLKHLSTDKGGKLVSQTGGKWTPTKAGIDRFAP